MSMRYESAPCAPVDDDRLVIAAPTGCDDVIRNDRTAMLKYLVSCAFTEALRGLEGDMRYGDAVCMTVLGIARVIAIEMLCQQGMTRASARELLNSRSRLLENMTDEMAKKAGFA